MSTPEGFLLLVSSSSFFHREYDDRSSLGPVAHREVMTSCRAEEEQEGSSDRKTEQRTASNAENKTQAVVTYLFLYVAHSYGWMHLSLLKLCSRAECFCCRTGEDIKINVQM